MKYITGHTRGLGKALCNRLNCIGVGRPQYNLEADVDKICDFILEDDLVILNAYAFGTQIEYVKRLYNKAHMVIIGSIAADYTDPKLLKYSQDKQLLEQEVQHLAIHSTKPLLYLKLTDNSYSDYELIYQTIQFWISNPKITSVGFNVKI